MGCVPRPGLGFRIRAVVPLRQVQRDLIMHECDVWPDCGMCAEPCTDIPDDDDIDEWLFNERMSRD